jgi:hypothetical protein
MTHGEPVFGEQDLDFVRQLEEPDHVRDGGTIFAGAAADFLVAEVVLASEAVVGDGDFDGVKVLALDVFDEGDFEEFFVGEILDNDGNRVESSHAGGTPAALAGDELVAVISAANDEGLDEAVGADGVGEFAEALFDEDRTGLDGVGIDVVNGEGAGGAWGVGLWRRGRGRRGYSLGRGRPIGE